jgi:hypothetical protein
MKFLKICRVATLPVAAMLLSACGGGGGGDVSAAPVATGAGAGEEDSTATAGADGAGSVAGAPAAQPTGPTMPYPQPGASEDEIARWNAQCPTARCMILPSNPIFYPPA